MRIQPVPCPSGAPATLFPLLQAAALRALGRLALLSEPLSERAVALAEAALAGGSSRSSAGTEVQAAAVALLADAIEAFPNAYSDRLLLIGRLMAPAVQPAAAAADVEATEGGPAGSGGADAADDHPASQQQQDQEQQAQQEEKGSEEAAQPAAKQAAPARPAATATAPALSPEQREQLARVAAASYCRLLLRNKLKLQGMLGPLGSALSAASPPVAALVQHALRQMLGAAAPKEQARLCMALFHQTPPSCRVALAQVRLVCTVRTDVCLIRNVARAEWKNCIAGQHQPTARCRFPLPPPQHPSMQALVDRSRGLLPAAELRGDVLVSQALQALLTAAQAATAQDGASLAAAATLLRAMQPSAKVLAALHTQLQAGSGGGGAGGTLLAKLPAAARQALQAFVSSHVPAPAGREDGQQAAGDEEVEGSGAGGKRKRAAGFSKGASAAVQQQLLALLGGGGGGGTGAATCRPPRPAATTTTATAGISTAADTSSAAPGTSTRRGGLPASSSRAPASSARPTRSRSRRRSARSRALEEECDSEASS